MTRLFATFAILGFGIFPRLLAQTQVSVDLSTKRAEYLLYEPIKVDVKVTNLLAQPLDLNRMSKKEPWLDFFVTVRRDEEIHHTEPSWKAPQLTLLSGQVKWLSVDLLPLFLIRDPGEYRVVAQVTVGENRILSNSLKFTVMNGTMIWEQNYTAPADPNDPAKNPRPRLYSLLVHRTEQGQVLYVRIQDPEQHRVYGTISLGNTIDYGKPHTRIDQQGNFHVLHQLGTRLFSYSSFSPSGKRLVARLFSDISSTPKLITGENDETLIVGGEEIFTDEKEKERIIPTPPLAPQILPEKRPKK